MLVTVDFETYYSREYSLSRMSEIDYILDPRFELICAAIAIGDAPARAVWGWQPVYDALAALDWSKVALLAHNNRFDGAIAAWRLGFRPAVYLDTLSMARALTHAEIGRSSLAAVSDYVGLPPKGDEVVRAIGKTAKDFTPDEKLAYLAYCARDAENCRDIFKLFRSRFPTAELGIIDWNLRMFIEPQARLDAAELAKHLAVVRSEKDACMGQVAHIDPAIFSSNPKFAALLAAHGVDVPTKVSKTTGEIMPALARNDVAFKELCADDTQPPMVQALLAARLSAKSTIEETRTATLLNLSLRSWGEGVTGWMPVPLKYYAAHTGRFGGDGGFNFQNLGRKSRLRHCIVAPKGKRIVHRDASQIEARMVAWMADCRLLLDGFRRGEDIYSRFASTVYGRTITKADTNERFVGKTSILGLGYGMGGERFRVTLLLGTGGVSVRVDLDEASRIVQLYRRTYTEIPSLWYSCGDLLVAMLSLSNMEAAARLKGNADRVSFSVAQANRLKAISYSHAAINLPNGLFIAYPDLAVEPGSGSFTYRGPYGDRRHLFGGKVVENISQGLSRVVITEIVNRVRSETGRLPFMTTHDSLDYLVPAALAAEWDDYLDRQFAIVPAWAPGLPLASEGGWGSTLAEAEARLNQ